jgi:hypothetical protein
MLPSTILNRYQYRYIYKTRLSKAGIITKAKQIQKRLSEGARTIARSTASLSGSSMPSHLYLNQVSETYYSTVLISRDGDPKLLISDPNLDPTWRVISDPDPA